MVEGDTGFFRDTSRWAPHNLYVALPEVASVLTGPGDCGTPLFSYRDDGSLPSGTVASQASVSYPAVWSTWTWNADTQRWDRADDGVSSTDASDGSAISATNVVVLSVEARNLDYTDVAGAPVPETVLEGEGRLDYFAGGQHMTGTWSKAGTNEPFVFTDDAGNTLQLVPGNTWVELLPSTGTLTVQ